MGQCDNPTSKNYNKKIKFPLQYSTEKHYNHVNIYHGLINNKYNNNFNIKNKANPIEEYSTLQPATNSASASGKSKGALLVSAKQEMKKSKSIGNKGKPNQTSSCANTILDRLSDPTHIRTVIRIRPIDTS